MRERERERERRWERGERGMLDARTGLFCGWRKKLILHPSNRLQRLDSVDGTSKAGWWDLWAWKPTNDHVVSTLDAIG